MRLSSLSFTQHVYLLTLIALVTRFILLWPIDLNDDEAYYWMWTQMPSLSYFDNTPGASWFLLPFTTLFGNDAWVIRTITALTGVFTAVAITLAASSYDPGLTEKQRIRILWLSSLSVMVFALTVVWTPDAPLLLFTSLALWQLFKALDNGSAKAWIWSGIFLALALLAKANTGVYIAVIGLWFVFKAGARQQLKTPWPWIAFFIVLLALLPVIIWNMQNDWAFLKFQGIHIFAPEPVQGEKAAPIHIQLDQVLLLAVSYLIAAGPAMVKAFALFIRLYRERQFSLRQNFAYSLAFITTGLFVVVSLYKPFGANWAILSMLVLFIVGITELVKSSKRWIWGQAAMVIPVLLLLLALNFIPATVNKAYNWRKSLVWPQMYQTMLNEQKKLPANTLLAADNYQDASQLAYYERNRWSSLPYQHAVPALNMVGRSNHYAHAWMEDTYRGYNMLVFLSDKNLSLIKPNFCHVRVIGKYSSEYLGQSFPTYYLVYGEKFLGRPDIRKRRKLNFDRSICRD